MLDLKLIRERLAWVKDRLSLRGQDLPWETFESLDKERREILQETESLKHRRNVVSEQIGRKKQEKQEAREAIEEMRQWASDRPSGFSSDVSRRARPPPPHRRPQWPRKVR